MVQYILDDPVFCDKLKASNFYDRYETEVTGRGLNGCVVRVDFPGMVMSFNKTYLDRSLLVLGDQDVNIYAKDSHKALLIQNEKITIMIMPVYDQEA